MYEIKLFIYAVNFANETIYLVIEKLEGNQRLWVDSVGNGNRGYTEIVKMCVAGGKRR